MGTFSDILRKGSDLRRAWETTDAAEEFLPLPAGQYLAHIIAGELSESRTNATPGYKLTFRVIEGEFVGRQFWHDLWLTAPALPMTKRDLKKIGVTDLDQLAQPLPALMRCEVRLVLQRADDGAEFNRVRRFEVVGIDERERDTFAPDDPPTRSDEADSKESD